MNDVTPKAVAGHRAATAEKHPQGTTAEATPAKPSKKTCTATSWQDGGIVTCELKPGHDGHHHTAAGQSWRPRSGDPRE